VLQGLHVGRPEAEAPGQGDLDVVGKGEELPQGEVHPERDRTVFHPVILS
jgi:hypothetical protein